ncbi:MAG: hypothetical protein AAFO91_09170, partial [Bacteroidota bacterium]
MKHAFHFEYPGVQRVLLTHVRTSVPFADGTQPDQNAPAKNFVAIWDTGATGSAITKEVVNFLGLKPTGVTEVRHAQGKKTVNTYLISIVLPNCSVVFNEVRVSEVDLIPD